MKPVKKSLSKTGSTVISCACKNLTFSSNSVIERAFNRIQNLLYNFNNNSGKK